MLQLFLIKEDDSMSVHVDMRSLLSLMCFETFHVCAIFLYVMYFMADLIRDTAAGSKVPLCIVASH